MSNPLATRTGRVADKVALVTGGASGIGRATALLLAAEGAAIAVADIDNAGAQATVQQIHKQGGCAVAYHLDVTDESAWPAVMLRLLAEFGQLDIAVNSAGIAFSRPVADTSLADWRRVQAINLDGVFLGTQAAIRAMRSQGRGSIVNLSAATGIRALPGAGAYGVSKAGVCMLTRVAALECAQEGTQIRVNAVLPSVVKTDIWKSMGSFREMIQKERGNEDAVFQAIGQKVPLKRYAEPEEVARAVLYLASDDAAYVTGTELIIDGGFTA
jgi:NAD(P)-dependent dehydrogenase (short-subunit alcohol dehydrogenase family)